MDIRSVIQAAIDDFKAIQPALDAVVSAINPAAGRVLAEAEGYLPTLEELTGIVQDLLRRIDLIRAQAGVPEVVWNEIADANTAADSKLIGN